MVNVNSAEFNEDMYRSCIGELYWSGVIEVLDAHSMSTLELALLSFACEYPHTIGDLTAYFSKVPEDFGYIDYPHYLPVENVSPATVERAVAQLLDRSIIGVADEQFIDAVRDHLAEGGLFSGLVSLPEVHNAVPLPQGVSIYKQIGRRLKWTWAECCRISRWCGMTCTSDPKGEPLFLRWSYVDEHGVTFDNHVVSQQTRLIGKWYSSWWNEHQKGYAILCRVANPDDMPAQQIADSTGPEVQMWRRDILFDDKWREGMTAHQW